MVSLLWCGNSPQSGAKVVALLDFALAIFHLAFGITRLVYPALVGKENDFGGVFYHFQDFPDSWGIQTDIAVTGLVRLFVFLAELCLVYLLLAGIKERDAFKCDVWIKIRLILLIIGVIGYSCEIIMAEYSEQYYLWWIVLALAVIYRIYTLLLVRSYYVDLIMYKGFDFTFLNST